MGWSQIKDLLLAYATYVSDITYIPTGEDWLYCVVIKDLFLKKVVGY